MEARQSLCNEMTFSGIYESYSTQLYNYLYYKCGDLSISEDLVQDAFMKLWQNCKTVAFDTAKGFVFTIAKNLLMNKFNRQKVQLKFLSTPQKTVTVESPEYLLEESEFKLKLEAAISSLPDKQREVFLLSRIEKMKYREIAELLEISVKAVEKRMHLALNKLREVHKVIK